MAKQEKIAKSTWQTETNVRKRHPKVSLNGPHKILGMTDKKFRMLMIDAYDYSAKAIKRMPTQKVAAEGDE